MRRVPVPPTSDRTTRIGRFVRRHGRRRHYGRNDRWNPHRPIQNSNVVGGSAPTARPHTGRVVLFPFSRTATPDRRILRDQRRRPRERCSLPLNPGQTRLSKPTLVMMKFLRTPARGKACGSFRSQASGARCYSSRCLSGRSSCRPSFFCFSKSKDSYVGLFSLWHPVQAASSIFVRPAAYTSSTLYVLLDFLIS